MIHSLIMVSFFALGLAGTHLRILPGFLGNPAYSTSVLGVLLLLVGICVGSNEKWLDLLKTAGAKVILVPLAVIAGTLAGSAAASMFVATDLRGALAVGSGFGYYSLSSILIAPIAGESLAVVAMLSNIFREIATLVFAPLLARHLGPLAPIASGGATAMDTCLSVVRRFSGTEYTVISIFSGTVLSFAVPVLVPLVLKTGL